MNPYDIVGWQLVFILSCFILFSILTIYATAARVASRRKTKAAVSDSIDQLNAFSAAARASLRDLP